MANRVSAIDCNAAKKSLEIDKQIEEDSKRYKNECKVLLLGELDRISVGYLCPNLWRRLGWVRNVYRHYAN